MQRALCVNLFNTVNDIIFVYKDVYAFGAVIFH